MKNKFPRDEALAVARDLISRLLAMTALFQVLAARAALTKKDSITDAAFIAKFESMLGGVLRKALKRVRRLNADKN